MDQPRRQPEDTDDGEHDVVDAQRTTDDVLRCAEPRLPRRIGENEDRRSAWRRIFLRDGYIGQRSWSLMEKTLAPKAS